MTMVAKVVTAESGAESGTDVIDSMKDEGKLIVTSFVLTLYVNNTMT